MPGGLQPGTPRQRSTPAAGSARTWPIRGVDGHRRVRGLVRIHSDHYYRHDWHLLPLSGGEYRGGHAQFQESQRRSRPSFEPRHGEAPARWHVVRKPSPAGAGSGYENRAYWDLSTLRARLTAIPAGPATPASNWTAIAWNAKHSTSLSWPDPLPVH